jgi:SulP family sulfate permease
MSLNLFSAARPIRAAALARDAFAAVTLAAVNIPQVLGYTRIAGTPVVTGLYTVLLPTIAFAALGSSRHLIVAADSATAAIFSSGLHEQAAAGSAHYMTLVGAVTLLTSLFLLIARLFRLGFLADFLSRTVLIGFLSGVGLQIAIAMLGELLGIPTQSHVARDQLMEVAAALARTHLPTLAVSASVLAAILIVEQIGWRFPTALLAVVAGIAASRAWDFAGRGIAVIGPVPGGLPPLTLPLPSWEETLSVLPLAISCGVIIIAQSAATSRVFATRYRERVDGDADILGLAVANLAAAATGAFVVNGSPSQTAVAERAGARSQIAQLTFAALVVAVLLFLTGPLADLPRGVLAAIVFSVGVRLIDLSSLRSIRRESPGEYMLALVTAGTVALVGVEQGILLAIGLSLLRHVRHSYQPHTAMLIPGAGGLWTPAPATPGSETTPGLIVYRFAADLFYANESRFCDELAALASHAPTPLRWILVDASAITDIDYTAAQTVRQLCEDLRGRGIKVVFARVSPYLRADMDRHGITAALGESAICDTLHAGLEAVRSADAEIDSILTSWASTHR